MQFEHTIQAAYQTNRMADEDNIISEVFVYTEGAVVPVDVVRVRVHPSITAIPRYAFEDRMELEDVELCEGLLEIGMSAFYGCNSLKRLTIPNTVRSIGNMAFESCRNLAIVELNEELQHIGLEAFAHCKSLKNDLCIPSNVTEIKKHAFYETSVRSLSLHDAIISIGGLAFGDNTCLRNIYIPPNAQVEHDAFDGCMDLQQLFDTDKQIVNALKHRFDNLPIHKMIYYQPYNNVTAEQLNYATNMRRTQKRSLRSKLDPSGSQQDCLGMTPLHIMACSTIQNVELYKVLVDKYPENLITEDRWGSIPLLYAIWGSVPDEIVQFLVDSYKSLYPNHVLYWTEMMVTLSRRGKHNNMIRTLLNVRQEFVPERLEVWIDELAHIWQLSFWAFRFLVQHGYTERVNAIGLKQLRDKMMEKMETPVPYGDKKAWLDSARSKLVQYEVEYRTLKEATTLLELALWKFKMDDESNSKNKRKRTEESDSDYRDQCRVSCSADIVIEHVLPYLLPSSNSA